MKTILVIEDEAQTREIFVQSLRFEGFHAIAAESGATGIELALIQMPDLIVCDIMMPDVNGYEVLTTLRHQPITAAIPFIFLTAKVTMAELRQGMVLGADDYLTKPCTVEQFLAAIVTRLDRQENFRQRYEPSRSKLMAEAVPLLNQSALPEREIASPTTAAAGIFPACPKLESVFCFIESHYHHPISLQDVAKAVGYSPAYLTNLVQTLTGRTVKQWITERRMAQARALLLNSAQSVNQVAAAVGYADVCYFIRQFRQTHGVSPQVWRKAPSKTTINMINYQAV